MLGDDVPGHMLYDGRERLAEISQVLKHHDDAHERVAAVMKVGEDDSAVALAAENGADFAHFFDDVDFADRRSKDLLTVACRDVIDGTARRKVRHKRTAAQAPQEVGSLHLRHLITYVCTTVSMEGKTGRVRDRG